MTIASDAAAPLEADLRPPAGRTAPLFWSVRRELWEHRSITFAPLIVAAVMVLGFLVTMGSLGRTHRDFLALDPAGQMRAIALPYDAGAAVLVFTWLLVGMFYCLAALNGERRDRTILFWKSLPVSDLTTVAAKASIPFLVLPAVTFLVIVAAQLGVLLINSAGLLLVGYSPAILWARLPLPTMWLVMLYALATVSLWYAPVWGWILLVSGWARRAPFLWAIGVPLGLCLFERIAFGSTHLFHLLLGRLHGSVETGFNIGPHDIFGASLSQLAPGKFLTDPGLWGGLLVGAVFLAGAVVQRRYRDPI